jgi:hypothetical protein
MIKNLENYKYFETGTHWFQKHTRSHFTRYTKIFAEMCWSYWIVVKYCHLTDLGRTKEAEGFIEDCRDKVFEKIRKAATNINEWNNIPSDIKALLIAIYKSTESFLYESIEMHDRINFHSNYGVKIEEPLNNLLETMEREQCIMRMYAQYTDEADINSLYYKWANIYYEACKYLSSATDINSWEIFRKYCQRNLRGTLPSQEKIESSAAAAIAHIEIKDGLVNSLAQNYTSMWLKLFATSAQFNHSLLFLTHSKEFPSDKDLKTYELLVNDAATKQIETSIALANMFINDEIYIS